jgi:hypothetical protein
MKRRLEPLCPKAGGRGSTPHFSPDGWKHKNGPGRTVFNFSADTIADAVKYFQRGVPVVTVVPDGYWKERRAFKQDGLTFMRCPPSMTIRPIAEIAATRKDRFAPGKIAGSLLRLQRTAPTNAERVIPTSEARRPPAAQTYRAPRTVARGACCAVRPARIPAPGPAPALRDPRARRVSPCIMSRRMGESGRGLIPGRRTRSLNMSRRVDLTPSWETAVQIYCAVLENPNASPEGREIARAEIVRLAQSVDAMRRARARARARCFPVAGRAPLSERRRTRRAGLVLEPAAPQHRAPAQRRGFLLRRVPPYGINPVRPNPGPPHKESKT